MLKQASGLVLMAVLLAGTPLLAQRGGGMMGMAPPVMNGVLNPVVGSGATYQMTGADGKVTTMTVEVIGKEDVLGKPGYWMEYLINDKEGKQTVMQQLLVQDAGQMTISKMIVQAAGQPAMMMPGSMLGMMAAKGGAPPPTPNSDARPSSTSVGSESITTPAGTFTCQHWRRQDGSSDFWVSPTAGPWGLVKSTSTSSSMMVLRVITDAKSHVVGPVMTIDPEAFKTTIPRQQ